MRSEQISPTTRIHRNGDWSGEVWIDVPSDDGILWDQENILRVKIDFEDLARIVANYVVDKRTERLENASWKTVLTPFINDGK